MSFHRYRRGFFSFQKELQVTAFSTRMWFHKSGKEVDKLLERLLTRNETWEHWSGTVRPKEDVAEKNCLIKIKTHRANLEQERHSLFFFLVCVLQTCFMEDIWRYMWVVGLSPESLIHGSRPSLLVHPVQLLLPMYYSLIPLCFQSLFYFWRARMDPSSLFNNCASTYSPLFCRGLFTSWRLSFMTSFKGCFLPPFHKSFSIPVSHNSAVDALVMPKYHAAVGTHICV